MDKVDLEAMRESLDSIQSIDSRLAANGHYLLANELLEAGSVVSCAIAELTARRARDAEVEALVAAARHVLNKAWGFGEDEPHFVALNEAVDALTGAKP